MPAVADLHPITRSCMGFHLWSLASRGRLGDQVEAAVTAARIAVSKGKGAVFRRWPRAGQRACDQGHVCRKTGSLARRNGERYLRCNAPNRRYRDLVGIG